MSNILNKVLELNDFFFKNLLFYKPTDKLHFEKALTRLLEGNKLIIIETKNKTIAQQYHRHFISLLSTHDNILLDTRPVMGIKDLVDRFRKMIPSTSDAETPIITNSKAHHAMLMIDTTAMNQSLRSALARLLTAFPEANIQVLIFVSPSNKSIVDSFLNASNSCFQVLHLSPPSTNKLRTLLKMGAPYNYETETEQTVRGVESETYPQPLTGGGMYDSKSVETQLEPTKDDQHVLSGASNKYSRTHSTGVISSIRAVCLTLIFATIPAITILSPEVKKKTIGNTPPQMTAPPLEWQNSENTGSERDTSKRMQHPSKLINAELYISSDQVLPSSKALKNKATSEKEVKTATVITPEKLDPQEDYYDSLSAEQNVEETFAKKVSYVANLQSIAGQTRENVLKSEPKSSSSDTDSSPNRIMQIKEAPSSSYFIQLGVYTKITRAELMIKNLPPGTNAFHVLLNKSGRIFNTVLCGPFDSKRLAETLVADDFQGYDVWIRTAETVQTELTN